MSDLNYTVDSLDNVPEPVRDFYAEQEGGGYALKVQGVVPKSQFDEVNQRAVDASTEAQRRRKTVERVTQKLGLETADGLDDALEGLLSKAAKGGKPDADQQAIVDQIKAQAEKEVGAVRGQLQQVLMGSAKAELKAALSAAKFHPEIVDDIAATALSRVSIEDDGKIRIMQADNSGPLAGSGAGGLATFADLASELAAAKPSFLLDAGKGGGGKPPASGSKGGAQTVTRAQFDEMSQHDRITFAKSGGKVVEG